MGKIAEVTEPRVAFVVSGLHPMGGLELATFSVAQALAGTVELRMVLLAGEVPNGLVECPFEIRSWGAKATGWRRVMTLARALRHRNEFRNEVVVVSGAWAAIPILAALPRTSRRRTIVWEHSFGVHQVSVDRRLAILRGLARFAYAKAYATVAVSDALKHDLRAAGFRGLIEVIPNPVRDSGVVPRGEEIPGRLVTIGSLRKVKNQDLALRTLAVLPERFSLDVLGDGPDREKLEELAGILGISHRVKFWGHVSEPTPHLARADMVIHPSIGETYGLVLFEAAQCGKPVVAVNQSVMAEFIPRLVPGMVAKPEPGAFAAAVLAIEAGRIPPSDFEKAAHERESFLGNIVTDWVRLFDSVNKSL